MNTFPKLESFEIVTTEFWYDSDQGKSHQESYTSLGSLGKVYPRYLNVRSGPEKDYYSVDLEYEFKACYNADKTERKRKAMFFPSTVGDRGEGSFRVVCRIKYKEEKKSEPKSDESK